MIADPRRTGQLPASQEGTGTAMIIRHVTLSPSVAGTEVTIGTSVRMTVALYGRDAEGAELGDVDFGVGWVVLDGPRRSLDANLFPGERPEVQLEWTLMPLESGEVASPPLLFDLAGGAQFVAEPTTIVVAPALLEGEDAARPLVEFRDVADRPVGDPWVAAAVVFAVVALPIVALVLRRVLRRQAVVAAPPEPTIRERIDALDPGASPAAAMAALGPLVRRAVDEAIGVERAALTDEEWTAEIASSETPSEPVRDDVVALVRELSVVRFGGAEPSSFAAKDAHGRALLVVESLTRASALPDGEVAA